MQLQSNLPAKQVQVEKYEKDGKVAVLYSFGKGWGWSVMSHHPEMAIDSRLVNAFITGGDELAQKLAGELYPPQEYSGYCVDCTNKAKLRLRWIGKGEPFYITSQAGHEEVVTSENEFWFTA